MPPLDRIRSIFRGLYRFSCEHPQYFALMFVPHVGGELKSVILSVPLPELVPRVGVALAAEVLQRVGRGDAAHLSAGR